MIIQTTIKENAFTIPEVLQKLSIELSKLAYEAEYSTGIKVGTVLENDLFKIEVLY